MLLNGFTLLDRSHFKLNSVSHLDDNVGKLLDLEKAVLAISFRSKVEPKVDLIRAVGDPENYLAAVFFRFVAFVLFACVLDNADNISTHIGEFVEELASLNVIFLAHYFSLKLITEVIGFGFRRDFSELGKAELSRRDKAATLECEHRVTLLRTGRPLTQGGSDVIGGTERTRTVIVFVDSEVHTPFCHGPERLEFKL